MTIRNFSATLIPALFFSFSLPGASGTLAVLTRAYRESPTPARRAAIATHVAAHPEDASLANLALGVAASEQKNWAGAIVALRDLMGNAYPQPTGTQLLHRADRLLDAKEYVEARRAYQLALAGAEGLERDQARVRAAAVDYQSGKAAFAWPALTALQVP